MRYVNLLLSYQFIFVFVFLVTPPQYKRFSVYGEDIAHTVMYFLIDFFGCADVLGTPTYNATWWYMSVALMLVTLMPLLQTLCKRFGYILLPLIFFALRYFNTYFTVSWYLPVAMLGILCAQENFIERCVQTYSNTSHLKKLLILILLTIAVSFVLWLRYKTEFCWDVCDLLITIYFVLIVCLLINRLPIVSPVLEFIGKYSMNIFLLHTFIFYYWFRDHVYSFQYPIVILAVLLFESLMVSFLLEWIKHKIHFDNFVKKVGNAIINLLYN